MNNTTRLLNQNFLAFFLFIISVFFTNAFSQDIKVADQFHDPLFPRKGEQVLLAGTGIPYVGLAEYSYGFSKRVSIGLLAGTTPIVPGIGIRVKYLISEYKNGNRLLLKTPILYYPRTRDLGGEPWILTWPTLTYEWRFKSGVRFGVGAGIVAAACVNDLLGIEHKHENEMVDGHKTDMHDHHHEHSHGSHTFHEQHMDEGFMGDAWNTIQTSLVVPLSPRLNFISEFAVVLDGTKIADEKWVGRHPVILFLGVTHSF